MPNSFKELKSLKVNERLFTAIIKQAIRKKEWEFFKNGKVEKLAEYFGIDVKIADLIKGKIGVI